MVTVPPLLIPQSPCQILFARRGARTQLPRNPTACPGTSGAALAGQQGECPQVGTSEPTAPHGQGARAASLQHSCTHHTLGTAMLTAPQCPFVSLQCHPALPRSLESPRRVLWVLSVPWGGPGRQEQAEQCSRSTDGIGGQQEMAFGAFPTSKGLLLQRGRAGMGVLLVLLTTLWPLDKSHCTGTRGRRGPGEPWALCSDGAAQSRAVCASAAGETTAAIPTLPSTAQHDTTQR